jgi:hypothetical protein
MTIRAKLLAALHESDEFNNFECHYGHTLGTCPESNHCLACNVKRILDAPVEPE